MYKVLGVWQRSRVGGGEGWVAGGRLHLSLGQRGSGTVFSVSDKNRPSPQDKTRWWFTAVWHHMLPYSGSTGPVVHPRGLTRLTKDIWNQTIYSYVLDVSWQWVSIAIVLGYKLDLITCVIWNGYCKSSHIC